MSWVGFQWCLLCWYQGGFGMLLLYKVRLEWLDGIHDKVVPKFISLAHFPSDDLL